MEVLKSLVEIRDFLFHFDYYLGGAYAKEI